MLKLEEASHINPFKYSLHFWCESRYTQVGGLATTLSPGMVAELSDKGLLEVDYFLLETNKVDSVFFFFKVGDRSGKSQIGSENVHVFGTCWSSTNKLHALYHPALGGKLFYSETESIKLCFYKIHNRSGGQVEENMI